MPTCLMVCESCGGRQTYFLDEAMMEDVHNRKPVSKHCLRCHTTTDWTFALVDRRTGRERRLGADRRDG